jgi:hypothetical protein
MVWPAMPRGSTEAARRRFMAGIVVTMGEAGSEGGGNGGLKTSVAG